MKVLTLTQPWATLVAIGAKTIETRSWYTDYRGPLAIHAAKNFPKAARALLWDEPFNEILTQHFQRPMSEIQLPLGKIVATTYLSDVLPICAYRGGTAIAQQLDQWHAKYWLPAEPEIFLGDYRAGRFAWMLENTNAISEPISAKGALGLWEYPALHVIQ